MALGQPLIIEGSRIFLRKILVCNMQGLASASFLQSYADSNNLLCRIKSWAHSSRLQPVSANSTGRRAHDVTLVVTRFYSGLQSRVEGFGSRPRLQHISCLEFDIDQNQNMRIAGTCRRFASRVRNFSAPLRLRLVSA